MSRKAMQVALEALESDPISHAGLVTVLSLGKGTGLNYALASQKTAVSPDGGTGFIDGVWHEPGPTAWRCQCGKPYTVTCISSKPAKQWVGLTDEEIYEYADKYLYQHGSNYGIKAFARAIEAKLKERNT
jgi:hypothetical protein